MKIPRLTLPDSLVATLARVACPGGPVHPDEPVYGAVYPEQVVEVVDTVPPIIGALAMPSYFTLTAPYALTCHVIVGDDLGAEWVPGCCGNIPSVDWIAANTPALLAQLMVDTINRLKSELTPQDDFPWSARLGTDPGTFVVIFDGRNYAEATGTFPLFIPCSATEDRISAFPAVALGLATPGRWGFILRPAIIGERFGLCPIRDTLISVGDYDPPPYWYYGGNVWVDPEPGNQ